VGYDVCGVRDIYMIGPKEGLRGDGRQLPAPSEEISKNILFHTLLPTPPPHTRERKARKEG
jgi:hypothetical protein